MTLANISDWTNEVKKELIRIGMVTEELGTISKLGV